MRSRAVQWLVLAWATLWLAVVAPGHQRGMIRTDSAEKPGKSSCCAGHSGGGKNEKKPSKDDAARHCALCYINASLDLPIVIDLSLRLSGLIDRLVPADAEPLFAADCASPFHGRAPPITPA